MYHLLLLLIIHLNLNIFVQMLLLSMFYPYLLNTLNLHLLYSINYYSDFPNLYYLHLVLLVLRLLSLNILMLNPIVLQIVSYLYNHLNQMQTYLLMLVLGYLLPKYMDMHFVLLLVFLLALLLMSLMFLVHLLFLFRIFQYRILHFDIHFLTFFVLIQCIGHLSFLLNLVIYCFHLNPIHPYTHLFCTHSYMYVNHFLFWYKSLL